MAAFSRIQLAKALIEYDNQDLPPEDHRHAEESAILSALRRHLPSRSAIQDAQSQARRSTDYLGVQLPSEDIRATVASRDSIARKSLMSIDALQNPFGRDSTHEGPLDMDDDVEVDLSSWGLDAFGDRDSSKKKGKQVKRQDSDAQSVLPNPHPPLRQTPSRRRPKATPRTMSMGNWPISLSQSREDLENFGAGGAFLDAKSTLPPPPTIPALGARRHSVGSPLDYADVRPSDPALHRRRQSEHALIDSIPITPPLHAVPFPHSDNEGFEETTGLAYDEREPDNTFALPPPTPDRASRFDPKVQQRERVVSTASIGTRLFSPTPGPGSPRPQSALSFDGPPPRAGKERPYSRLELMRPKVLIMPSPLQNAGPSTAPAPQVRDGFEITTDGRPMPPGARTAARASTASLLSPAYTGDGFTPNPRSSMTLSQLTFRNTLMVDGQRDPAYRDIDDRLQWATKDGEQAQFEAVVQEDLPMPAVDVTAADEDPKSKRAPGKLYGRSLIDDLEARKAEMKGKQRVFTGDQRPSMMARTPMQRSSTLIDPDSLKQRPTSTFVQLDSAQTMPNLTRRNTLLNFDDEIPGAPRGSAHLAAPNHPGGANNTRSVFGVDTIWERELAKLREMEKAEEEERLKALAEAEAEAAAAGTRKGKKNKGKKKGDKPAGLEPPSSAVSPSPSQSAVDERSPAPAAPPSPNSATQKRLTRYPPPPPQLEGDDESDDDDSDSSSVAARPAQVKQEGWYSDEDKPRKPTEPVRTTGTGLRYPNNLPPRLRAAAPHDDDSEEDLPLVATIGRAAQRATRADLAGLNVTRDSDSSDEDKPLAAVLDKTKQKLPSPASASGTGGGLLDSFSQFGLGAKSGRNDEDEDDKPLGLRVSRLIPGSVHSQAFSVRSGVGGGGGAGGGDEDEDDKPLGLHPEQLRKSQYIMGAQQQQQMMLAQAQAQAAAAAQMQMQQQMMFGAPSIMSGFYGPMPPPMMMAPQLPTTPPPIQDTAKLNRVDKWRHDVAVEGGQ